MSIESRFPVSLFLLAILCGLSLVGQVAPPAAAADAKPQHRQAHDFVYTDINPRSPTHGKQLALKELYAEKGVVLNFIASWCAPCWLELPAFKKLDRKLEAPVICVAADEHGPPSDLLRLAANAELDLPILLVPKAEIAQMEQYYDHSILPSTYWIGEDGGIRKLIQGMVSEERLFHETREALTGTGLPERAARGRGGRSM